jgi:hypothetical protein
MPTFRLAVLVIVDLLANLSQMPMRQKGSSDAARPHIAKIT